MSVRLDVPLLQQPCGSTCVNTCARMICAFFGHEFSHKQFLKFLPYDEDGYILTEGGRAISKAISTRYKSLKPSARVIENWLNKGFPILACDEYTYDECHCTIISGVHEDGRFYVIEPNEAKEYLIDRDVIMDKQHDEFVVIYK